MLEKPTQKIPLFFYRSNSGKEPVRDWLLGLEVEERQEIGKDLMRVQWRWPVACRYAARWDRGYGSYARRRRPTRSHECCFVCMTAYCSSCMASSRRRRRSRMRKLHWPESARRS